MRSGHSLAFKEFEEVRSKVKIVLSKSDDKRVIKFLKDNLISNDAIKKTFLISWESKSEWGEDNQRGNSSGESILVPIEISKTEGNDKKSRWSSCVYCGKARFLSIRATTIISTKQA